MLLQKTLAESKRYDRGPPSSESGTPTSMECFIMTEQKERGSPHRSVLPHLQVSRTAYKSAGARWRSRAGWVPRRRWSGRRRTEGGAGRTGRECSLRREPCRPERTGVTSRHRRRMHWSPVHWSPMHRTSVHRASGHAWMRRHHTGRKRAGALLTILIKAALTAGIVALVVGAGTSAALCDTFPSGATLLFL